MNSRNTTIWVSIKTIMFSERTRWEREKKNYSTMQYIGERWGEQERDINGRSQGRGKGMDELQRSTRKLLTVIKKKRKKEKKQRPKTSVSCLWFWECNHMLNSIFVRLYTLKICSLLYINIPHQRCVKNSVYLSITQKKKKKLLEKNLPID